MEMDNRIRMPKHKTPKQNQDWVFLYKRQPVEITDEEWDKIYEGFDEWETFNLYEDFEPTFSLYLKILIELKIAERINENNI